MRRFATPFAPFAAPIAILALQLVVYPVPSGVFVRGVLVGAVTSLIALGMALIYRSNRVVNFAQGDLGAAPAVLVFLLLNEWGWPYPVAVLAGGCSAVLLGGFVEVAVIRRFARAPRLVLTVATIGLAQLLIALAVFLPRWFGLDGAFIAPRISDPFDVRIEIGQTIFRANSVIAMIVTPVAIAGLAAFLRFTRVGVGVRAAADRATRAASFGVPVHRVHALVWAIAALLAFTATFLRAGILGLPVGSVLSLGILLRSLTALLLGGMTRLTVIASSAIALGVLELGIDWHRGDPLPLIGIELPPLDAVLALVILVALLVKRRPLARTSLDEQSSWRVADEVRPVPPELMRLGLVRWGRVATGTVLLGVAVALPHALPVDASLKASALLIYAMLTLSLVVLTGWAGQVSLGQVAFFAIGAAIAAKLTTALSADLTIAVLVAGAVGAFTAVLVGLPALRFGGLQLAVTTFAFALATTAYVLDRSYFDWIPNQRVERLPLLGRIDIDSPTRIYYVALAALVLTLTGLHGIRRSRTGRVLIALRDNERAAQAYGISAVRARLTAFALSGFIASSAGALFVHHQQAFGSSPYAPAQNLTVFSMAVVGGVATLPGAVLGALYVLGAQWFLPQQWQFLATGVGILFVLMVFPSGLGGLVHSGRDRLLRRIATRRSIAVPSLLGQVEDLDLRNPGTAATGDAGRDSGTHERPAATPTDADPLLAVRGVEVAYGDVQVLFGVDLTVGHGEIVALLGTNGAGKSTLLDAVSGIVGIEGGSVHFAGNDIANASPQAIAALGIAQVPGGRGVFPSLTVDENLDVGQWLRRGDTRATRDDVLDLFPALADRRGMLAGDLSGGQQQMLALAMAFSARPRFLMIDELSLGLAPVVVAQLLPALESFRSAGTTILLVEQSVNVALDVADRAVFLDKGEIRYSGTTDDLLERPDVLRAAFLTPEPNAADDLRASAQATTRRDEALVTEDAGDLESPLQCVGVSVTFGGVRAVDQATLHVRSGEILGIVGPNGAGKTTLFDAVSGFTPLDAGVVRLDGRDVTADGPARRAQMGLGRSFQDSRLFPSLTVHEAIAVATERSVGSRSAVAAALRLPATFDSEAAVRRRVDELTELLHLGPYRNKFVAELSTGARRIVDLAGLLAHQPTVVLLDEPSSGIAQRDVDELGPMLERIRAETGASLIVIEHDMPLLRRISDRLVAMDQGRIIATGPPADVLTHRRVVESYLGPDHTAPDPTASDPAHATP